MPQRRTRLVRRAPLSERIKAYLDPWDFLLWLSEEFNANEWDEAWQPWATPLGIALNIVFMIARANSGSKGARDDVFADTYEGRGSGWLAWLAAFASHFLTLLSIANAFYTFFRKKHYRLFEQSVEDVPSTPSARRVRVDSSPLASSPFRYFSNILTASTAESRSHPDQTRDVWELSIWDPTQLNLRLFSLFSPGHVLIYYLFFPLHPLDPRPSVTTVTTITLTTLLSIQLILLQVHFIQQTKDYQILHKQVQNEYDVKYVHPSLHKPVRDAGTQMNSHRSDLEEPEVLVSTQKYYVNKGFKTNPNPNYSPHYDPDANTRHVEDTLRSPYRQRESSQQPTGSFQQQQRFERSASTPLVQSSNSRPTSAMTNDFSSPLASVQNQRQNGVSRNVPYQRQPMSSSSQINQGGSGGDGGNLGVYSHSRSPLKKREGSPLKRMSVPSSAGGAGAEINGDARTHPHGYANANTRAQGREHGNRKLHNVRSSEWF